MNHRVCHTKNMKKFLFCLATASLLLTACGNPSEEHRVVVCVPVYGQSLALGEETELVTNLDSLGTRYDGRIVTERLDHDFGYFDNNALKQWGKRLIGYKKHSFELSLYGMAETLAAQTGSDTLICIFPGGQGATAIAQLSKGTTPYERFIENIKTAADKAREKGWTFIMPAVCWMQGESDIEDYPDTDYKRLLAQFADDLNADVKTITGQEEEVRIVCYQSNNVTGGERYRQDAYDCVESRVPQAQMELVRDDQRFWASGPTYYYTFARERIHIDGDCQNRQGQLAARSVLDILRGGPKRTGLVPVRFHADGQQVVVHYHVPVAPLQLDTINVSKAPHYGFSVVTPDGRDILQAVNVVADSVVLGCTEKTDGCRVRYALNGEKKRSGRRIGPRGNLRDTQGDQLKAVVRSKAYPLHNWSYQYDQPL